MIVIDTHVLIWAFQNDDRLGRGAAGLIEAEASRGSVMVPAICALEIARLDRAGRVPFAGDGRQWIRDTIATPGFALADLSPDIAFDAEMMAGDHRDPADRMIVATARHFDCPLLTADRAILAHAAAGHLKAIDARL